MCDDVKTRFLSMFHSLYDFKIFHQSDFPIFFNSSFCRNEKEKRKEKLTL